MKKEAEAHSEEDKNKKELAEARNTADALLYTAEKSLREVGDKITEEKKKETQEKIDTLKKTKDGADARAIKKETEELSRDLQEIGEVLYKAAQEKNQNNPQNAEEGEKDAKEKGENIKDADYEEMDKKDNENDKDKK